MRPYKLSSILFVILLITFDAAYFFAGASVWWVVILFVVYIHSLVLGAIYIQWNFYIKSFNKSTNQGLIALTFDDGPGTETAAILDILKAQSVPATFFSIGKNVAAHPELVKRWYDEGHTIGNHSFNHGFNFDWQSSKAMARELQETNDAIKRITGKSPVLFRPPYGVTNPNLARAVKKTGMYSIGWNVRSFDTTAKDPKQLLDRILNRLQGGDIILLHDSMPITREILTELIVRARQKGFTFARVDQMFDIEAYA
ncbi:MAG: polysaccharide deacetylase family protein [Bacteroidetes bacterium]|nr:polysaccharide deacetylase family protein [Bacteroidota bacterium]